MSSNGYRVTQTSPRMPSGAVGNSTAEFTTNSLPVASSSPIIPVPRRLAALSLKTYHSVAMLFSWAEASTT